MIDLKNKRVLITGAGGFIGSHLTEELIKQGVKVKAFLRYTSNKRINLLSKLDKKLLNKIDYYFGDLKDCESVKQAMKDIDIVFHLGALIGVPYSFVHPQDVFLTNSQATLNILTAAKEFKTARIIITSTSEVYGTAQYVPIDEKHPLNPQSPYAASKIASDSIALSFYYAYNLPLTIIRPFNTYGPRQSMRAVIPTIISQAIKEDKIKLGRVDTKRDFTFVKDTVQGFIKAGISSKGYGKIINLGSQKNISIGEIVKIVGDILNKKIDIETDKKRFRPGKSEVLNLLASTKKAKEIFGWEPKYDIREGLEQTISYISNNIIEYVSENYHI
jgi:dTDP-glucose 4,6-dehydratase